MILRAFVLNSDKQNTIISTHPQLKKRLHLLWSISGRLFECYRSQWVNYFWLFGMFLVVCVNALVILQCVQMKHIMH